MLTNKQKFEILYDLLIEEIPQKADAIIWLQGDRQGRAFKTYKLYKDGCAKKIIISGNDILIGNKTRVGEKNISLDRMKTYLLKKGIQEKVILIDNGAMNTKEQAEHVLKMALEKKWSKLILVGSSYYQPRAFLTFLKQAKKMKWNGGIMNQPAIIDLNKKPGGRGKTAKVLFNEEFKKIKKYKKDMVSVNYGIRYLNK